MTLENVPALVIGMGLNATIVNLAGLIVQLVKIAMLVQLDIREATVINVIQAIVVIIARVSKHSC